MIRAALYARYSTDKQREASIEDQARNCRRVAEREGWQLGKTYQDQAVSGCRADRAGYQSMLADAKTGQFDVLLVDDISRLSRDQVEAETTFRRLEHWGVRVIGVSDGYDSEAKIRKVHRAVKNLMNEVYLDDLAEKTHRGLEGQARAGNNAGGHAYGYRHVPIEDAERRDSFGRPVVVAVRREIESAQAQTVRNIFDWYATGYSLAGSPTNSIAYRSPLRGRVGSVGRAGVMGFGLRVRLQVMPARHSGYSTTTSIGAFISGTVHGGYAIPRRTGAYVSNVLSPSGWCSRCRTYVSSVTSCGIA